MPTGFSLNPTDPRSLEFIEGLYDQLLPCFTSRLFNVGCDETFDIGGWHRHLLNLGGGHQFGKPPFVHIAQA